MKTMKVNIKVEIPDYSVKFCDHSDFIKFSKCRWLRYYDFGFKAECLLSSKQIKFNPNINRDIVPRPYGCRCIAKNAEMENK